ncbi:rhodanese-like domain-containing protein [Aliiglaciecola lipolytica]|uniref:Rhodanese domain protein n=1 Tax=Aliiglaciecola lipolytica E3 TaxID=1127673 RepID=K6YHI6_9ALTE|nr:rhodanese-like domain-containing protein [Aliiglaciecola lipolytica]GAC16088.1 rhodanese domain protein [Aliiglaciecola lipolytica E3]
MDQIIEFVGNHPFLSAGWVALFVLIIYSYVAGVFSPVKELSTHEATILMNREDAVVLDVRPAAEYNKGHILGAKQLKAEQISKADFSTLEKFKDKPIIVVCAMGMSAKKTATALLKAGFTSVSVLKGGMNSWQGASLPVTK